MARFRDIWPWIMIILTLLYLRNKNQCLELLECDWKLEHEFSSLYENFGTLGLLSEARVLSPACNESVMYIKRKKLSPELCQNILL